MDVATVGQSIADETLFSQNDQASNNICYMSFIDMLSKLFVPTRLNFNCLDTATDCMCEGNVMRFSIPEARRPLSVNHGGWSVMIG